MTVVLDTGALIALDRGHREVWSRLRIAIQQDEGVLVPAGVIGQAWRDPGRQAQLSWALKRCDEIPLDGAAARSAGQLCGRTGTADVIDASVALAVADSERGGNEVVLLTSDTTDMYTLISALNTPARILGV